MVVEFAISLVIGFVVVVVGSYLGSKMALNTFFGRDFDPSDMSQSASSNPTSDESDR
ncbi:hypothetical protein ACLI4R_01045 [Natrialbaceae archaeon A-chndr2]